MKFNVYRSDAGSQDNCNCRDFRRALFRDCKCLDESSRLGYALRGFPQERRIWMMPWRSCDYHLSSVRRTVLIFENIIIPDIIQTQRNYWTTFRSFFEWSLIYLTSLFVDKCSGFTKTKRFSVSRLDFTISSFVAALKWFTFADSWFLLPWASLEMPN